MTTTIKMACEAFLANIKLSQPHNTWKNYRSDLLGRTGFITSLAPHVKPTSPVNVITEEHGRQFIKCLLDNGASPSTRQRRAAALREFFRFASDQYELNVSVDRLNFKLKSSHLLTAKRDNIQYPAEKIKKMLDRSIKMPLNSLADKRDLALLWTLAETGARVSEACNFKVGAIDRKWRITFIGKGNKQATVRFGKRARGYIMSYLKSRAALDAACGQTHSILPLFARHDEAVGKNNIKPISPKRAEKIIHHIARLTLGEEYDDKITCHTLRHYFITEVYAQTGGDLKAAKELGRHENIQTTDRYAHRDSEQNAVLSEKIFG